jgi:hypothetical protein
MSDDMKVPSSWILRSSERMFATNISSPFSCLEMKPGKHVDLNAQYADQYFLACFILVSCFVYSSTLKMEATYCSQTSSVFS